MKMCMHHPSGEGSGRFLDVKHSAFYKRTIIFHFRKIPGFLFFHIGKLFFPKWKKNLPE
jgi:hypothetical protein